MGGSIEPGWYADPQGDAQTLRWWNGNEWTRHTRSLSELQGGADGPDEEAARAVLEQCDFHVKTAIVALSNNTGVEQARALLEAARGSVRQALAQ